MNNTIGDGFKTSQNLSAKKVQTPEENNSGIDIQDKFSKTGGEGRYFGKIIGSVGAGTALGIGIANTNKINKIEERLSKLETEKLAESGGAKKSLYQKLLNCIHGNKKSEKVDDLPAASDTPREEPPSKNLGNLYNSSAFTVGYARECLEKSANCRDESRLSLFKSALECIGKSSDSTPIEKGIAKYALDRQYTLYNGTSSFDPPRVFSILCGEALKFLSEPKNTKDSFGKAVVKIYDKADENISPFINSKEDRDEESRMNLLSAIKNISHSPLSTPYEKAMSHCYCYTNTNIPNDSFRPNNDFKNTFINSILEASDNSNSIKDMANLSSKYRSPNCMAFYNSAFQFIIKNPDSSEADKTLAKQGLLVGNEGVALTKENMIKGKWGILEKIAG